MLFDCSPVAWSHIPGVHLLSLRLLRDEPPERCRCFTLKTWADGRLTVLPRLHLVFGFLSSTPSAQATLYFGRVFDPPQWSQCGRWLADWLASQPASQPAAQPPSQLAAGELASQSTSRPQPAGFLASWLASRPALTPSQLAGWPAGWPVDSRPAPLAGWPAGWPVDQPAIWRLFSLMQAEQR